MSKKQSKKGSTDVLEESASETKAGEKVFSFDSIAEVHGEIQEGAPDPNEAAIAAQSEVVVEQTKAAQGNTDKAGTVFNPALHAVNSEGEPSVTPLGKFRKRRQTSKVSTQNEALAAQQVTAEQEAAARAAGQLAADLMVGSACTLLGDEWVPIGAEGTQEPLKFDEHANLRRAFGDYFVAKNISDFPPGMALSIALTSYAMPRIAAGKETQTRLMKAKIWVSEKFNKLRKRDKENAAQSDRRDNGERENDAGKKVRGTKQATK